MSNFTRVSAREITCNNFEISLVVFMSNITTNHAITYTNELYVLLASTDDGKSQLLWPSISVGIVAILVVMIVIVMKQKWWIRANSKRSFEVCERNDH